jgi:transposase
LVKALQALRGVRLIMAVILAAEIGDYTRFGTPRELMAYLGLVPSELSSGERRRQGRITRTGNGHVRRILTEASWNYRFRPRASYAIRKRREGLPREIVAIAEKAEVRLSRRYQHLIDRGKKPQKVVTAVARELAGFVWAIAQEVTSKAA